jgi:N-acyl-D-amino-acid deacylase
MTSLAADAFGIAERGRIRAGAFADLVLFDPERIVDTATYARPYSYPLGIDSVWVNGQAVVRRGETTGARPGRALRGGK